MFTIHLHNLIFFAHHGIHDEEKILGNEYNLNVDIEIDPQIKVKHIDQTVNYVTVYEIIKNRMKQPTPLLETLVQDLAEQIHKLDDRIISIAITLKKNHPPIANIQGNVGISYKQTYS